MSYGNLWTRLAPGVRRDWAADRYRAALPADIEAVGRDDGDRRHAKQGRSTSRHRFDGPDGAISVYLKRHDRLPLAMRLRATLAPGAAATPAAVERSNLDHARSLGIAVPEVVAVGERVGPMGRLGGYLMVAELVGQVELNLAIPRWRRVLSPPHFESTKREILDELATIAARLHLAHTFHKDLYLCHLFVDPDLGEPAGARLTLIDLHRMATHRLTRARWRVKDLAQLVYSTEGVEGLDPRDLDHFWSAYAARAGVRNLAVLRILVEAKAARYRGHNRKGRPR